ncbi:MAG: acyl-CoA thioesterase [Pirellulales bacterium]|nr:acyl-CoA thioesterase [Planctomycetales bacterium]
MPSVYHHPIVVDESAIDRMGHVNNLRYLAWIIDAAVAHSDVQGWSGDDHDRIGSGWVVRSHQIRYLQPAFAGEALRVVTWIASAKSARCLRRYKIVRPTDRAILASAETEWAYVSFATGAPIRVPREVIGAFDIVADDPDPFAEVDEARRAAG